MIEVEVTRTSDLWERVSDAEGIVMRAAGAAEGGAPRRPEGPLAATVLLADNRALRDLNARWRDIDRPTNVLSFPADGPAIPGEARHLGDLALAAETVLAEAKREGKSAEDHLAHLVVHGILHLLGEDHATDSDADAMEALETRILAALGIGDPHRDRAL